MLLLVLLFSGALRHPQQHQHGACVPLLFSAACCRKLSATVAAAAAAAAVAPACRGHTCRSIADTALEVHRVLQGLGRAQHLLASWGCGHLEECEARYAKRRYAPAAIKCFLINASCLMFAFLTA
jgi:hypothetical protein